MARGSKKEVVAYCGWKSPKCDFTVAQLSTVNGTVWYGSIRVSSRNRHVAPIEGRGQRPTTAHSSSTTTHPPIHCLLTTFSLDNFRSRELLGKYFLILCHCSSSHLSQSLKVPTTYSRSLETLGAVTRRGGILSCLLPPPMKDKYLWEVWKEKHDALHNEMPHVL